MTVMRSIGGPPRRHSVTGRAPTSTNVGDSPSDSAVTHRLRTAGPDDALRELVRNSRAAQGLPPVVEDVSTLSRVADMFALVEGRPRVSSSGRAA